MCTGSRRHSVGLFMNAVLRMGSCQRKFRSWKKRVADLQGIAQIISHFSPLHLYRFGPRWASFGAPTGPLTTAWGIAPGKKPKTTRALKGRHTLFRPFRAWNGGRAHLGRCPRLPLMRAVGAAAGSDTSPPNPPQSKTSPIGAPYDSLGHRPR